MAQLKIDDVVIAEMDDNIALTLIRLAQSPGFFRRLEVDPMFKPECHENFLDGSSLRVAYTEQRVDVRIDISFELKSTERLVDDVFYDRTY